MFSIYLCVTVFLTGGIVMLVEVLGARIIAPFFGSSVYVWTAVISVTLLALALGYWLGGLLADRFPRPRILYLLIAAAGAYLFLVRDIKYYTLGASLELGLRSGALVSSLILFSPPLFILGMVTPYAVKLYADRMERLGSEVGVLYSLSTIGSFLGTVLTGFWLIPRFGVSRILMLAANTLILLSILYFLLFARRSKYLLLIILFGVNVFFAGEEGLLAKEVNGELWRELYKADSFYGRIRVIEKAGKLRYLFVDGVSQGGMNAEDGLSTALYTYVLEALSRMACPGAKRALCIGLGSGALPRAYSRLGIATDAVDIDGKIADIYKSWFDYGGAGFNIFVEDGRSFIKRAKGRYDIIILDVFIGDAVPFHLLTLEAFQEMKMIMGENGALVINFLGAPSSETDSKILASIRKTLSEVFPQVLVFGEQETSGRIAVNIFFLASLKSPSFNYAMDIQIPFSYMNRLHDITANRLELKAASSAAILTDDYNPVEFYTARTKESLRRNILNSLDKDFLLD